MAYLASALLVWLLAPQDPRQEGRGFETEGREAWKRTLAPSDLLYEPYLADPRQSRTGTKLQSNLKGDEHTKLENVLGIHQSLYRWEKGATQIEVAFEGASFSRFDMSESLDMDAADYRFGFPVTYRTGDFAFKIHPYHLTSHLGDEYIENRREEGIERADYHQEEIALGMSWDAMESLRFYAELGFSWLTNGPAKNGRAQLGVEWRGAELVEGISPYAALDLQTKNEIDWELNATFGAGLLFGRRGSPWRMQFGFEFYRGRDQQTQFLDEEQSYWGLGLSVELRFS